MLVSFSFYLCLLKLLYIFTHYKFYQKNMINNYEKKNNKIFIFYQLKSVNYIIFINITICILNIIFSNMRRIY